MSVRTSALALALTSLSLLLGPLVANAALYAPGATLDPACAPTDPNCGIATAIASSTASSIPYYASNGSLLSATSSLTILQNGNIGIGTTSPFTTLSVAGNGYFSGSLNVGDASTTRSNLGLGYAASSDITNSMNIAAWGDSLTNGGQGNSGNGISYRSVLATLVNKNIYNGGVSGNTSTQIAARMLAAPSMYSWPMIIWAGRNDFGTPATVESNIASMVAAATSTGNNNYIILSVMNGPGEPSGSANYNLIIGINNYLAATYGSHYLDVREYIVQNGLSVSGIATSTQDQTDYSNDVPETDLRADSLVHLNDTGYTVVANYIYQHINLLKNYPTTLVSTQNLANVFNQSVNVDGFINTDQYSGYKQNGFTILYASTTSTSLTVGSPTTAAWMAATSSLSRNTAIGYLALSTVPSGNAIFNTAIGYGALYSNTSGQSNSGVGSTALYNNTSGSYNAAIGVGALSSNITGSNNVAVGYTALNKNTSGSSNVGIGWQALYSNTTGANNSGVGLNALYSNTSGSSNSIIGRNVFYYNISATSSVGVGFQVAYGAGTNYYNQGGVYLGYQSGYSAATNSDFNTFLGYQSGYDVTSGNDNILIGPELNIGGSHLTTGMNNIGIGYNVIFPGGTSATNQLNIGNFIFGTGLTATSSATSIPAALSGSLAIGTSSPSARLTVWGPDSNATTTAFNIVNSASTTAFAVYDNGNATYAGSIFNSSDQRLKTDITPLDASSSLAAIEGLTPVSYTRLDQPGTGTNLGFLAQAVQQIFPSLVSTTSATALTPGGTLTLNYVGLIAPLVRSVQALAGEISSLSQAVTTNVLTAVTGNFDVGNFSQKICISGTCISGAQLQMLMQSAGQGSAPGPSPIIITDVPASPAAVAVASTTPDDASATSTPDSSASQEQATSTAADAASPPASAAVATTTDSAAPGSDTMATTTSQ